MALIDFLSANAPWSWIVAGLVLLALELVVPGGYLLWLGISAIVTGLLVLVWAISWPLQWLIFGILGLVAIFTWTRWTRGRRTDSDRPLLNRRTDQFIGQIGVLDEPIAGGFGRLHLGDTVLLVEPA
jgi:membrane protein implicated in regulation of membrane protease activity